MSQLRPNPGVNLSKFASRSGLSLITGPMTENTEMVCRKQEIEAVREKSGPVPRSKKSYTGCFGVEYGRTTKSDCLRYIMTAISTCPVLDPT
jgi:hypothetical protein